VSLHPEIVTARCSIAVSRGDGRWRASMTAPPDGWRLPGFDDSAFVPLVEKDVPEPKDNKKWSWEFLCKEAKGLGLPAPPGPSKGWLSFFRDSHGDKAWVRWSFRVDDEGFA
jgi:hypothetical protein